MQEIKNKPKILVVDDEHVHRYMLTSLLSEWGWECAEADDGVTAVEAVEQGPFDAILMDVRMTVMDGMEALQKIHAINPAIPVVIMTAYSSVDSAVAAIKKGAHDYLTKPLDFDRLRETLEVAMGHRSQTETSALSGESFGDDDRIIGSSETMQDLWDMVLHVAPTEATVLITGESGTGKELVASGVHYKSHRAKGPFIKVNCAALAENLLESELFGHEKGAFTGADLQEHELQRVGGQETLSVDVRIITATNRDLENEVALGNFREDLFYRLNVVVLDVPALRDRQGDIPLLSEYFLRTFAEKNNRQVTAITPECMDVLNRYPWPGNVRELENSIERAVILMRGEYLDINALPLTIQRWADKHAPTEVAEPATLKEAEKALILKTLEETGGNRSEAARRLQITRKTLLNKLKSYEEQVG